MNVLVVGVGMMGFNHVRNFSSFNNVKHVTVVDPSEEALKKVSSLGHGDTVSTYKTVDDALKNEKVDAATVIVPTHSHYKVASGIVAQGIPVLVEKPITENIEDGKKLIAEAKDRGVMLMVGHIERFNPAVQALKKNLSHIGTPFYASVHRFGVPTERDVGPSFIDQAVHDIDVLTFLVGHYPTEVSAVESMIVDKKSNDLCSAIFAFNSFKATVEANRVTPIKSRELIILGTAGAAKMDYITQDLTIMRSDHVTTKYSTFDEIVLRVGRGSEIKPYFVKDEPLKLELQHFLDCVKNKKEPLTTGMDGLHALAAAVAGMKAAKTGKREQITV